jgi:hypothetical protein
MRNSLADSPIIRRKSDLLEAEVEGELIGLHVDNGTCYGFNATATRVWALLEQPRSFEDLCAALTSEYEVDPASCRREVTALLSELEGEGLIEIEGTLPAASN